MAIGACAIARGRASYGRPGKVDNFGSHFKVRILADSDEIKPFRNISGKVVVDSRFPVSHRGLFIRLEGVCSLRYSTKVDNRTTFHQVRKCILGKEGCDEDEEGPPPIGCTMIKLLPSPDPPYAIKPGTLTYPFSFEVPENPQAPSGFKISLGCIVYRLVVYMRSSVFPSYTPVEVGELPMKFGGHNNLLDNLDVLKPVTVKQFYKKSVFKRRTLVETLFSLETAGFLPGESIPFVLYVKNPRLIPLQLEMELVHQRKLCAKGTADSTKKSQIIVSKKDKDCFEPETEVTWIESLNIGENQEPTYTLQFVYNVIYYLRYRVKILDHGCIKGEVPIVIGSTRDSPEVLKCNANTSSLERHFPGFSRHRSSSVRSVRSISSTTSSTYTLPPAYSQLSSRKPSLETLPPNYDEMSKFLEDDADQATWKVPRSPPPDEETSDEDDAAEELDGELAK